MRRRRDGQYVQKDRQNGPNPKFVPSLERAKMVVRIDLGGDLDDYEFLTREQVAGRPRPVSGPIDHAHGSA
jgi:hypothetical protein